MLISQNPDKKKGPVPSKFKSKVTMKKTWDAKKEMVIQRLMDFTQNMNDEQGYEDMDIPLLW